MNYVILMSSSSENDKTQPTDTATHTKKLLTQLTLYYSRLLTFLLKGKLFFDNLPATVTHPSTYVSINYFFCNSIALFEG